MTVSGFWTFADGSYFSDKYQRVLINNSSSNTTTFSELGKIKHVVPQGSILGPCFS